MKITFASLFLISFVFAGNVSIYGGAMRFLLNEAKHFDFADQCALPPTFGAGEFTLEL